MVQTSAVEELTSQELAEFRESKYSDDCLDFTFIFSGITQQKNACIKLAKHSLV